MARSRSILSRRRSNEVFFAPLDVSSVGVNNIYRRAAFRLRGEQENEGVLLEEQARGNNRKFLFAF